MGCLSKPAPRKLEGYNEIKAPSSQPRESGPVPVETRRIIPQKTPPKLNAGSCETDWGREVTCRETVGQGYCEFSRGRDSSVLIACAAYKVDRSS